MWAGIITSHVAGQSIDQAFVALFGNRNLRDSLVRLRSKFHYMALLHRTSYYSIQPEKFFDASQRAFYQWLETRGQEGEIDISQIGRNGSFAEVGANQRAREENFTLGNDRYARYSQMVTGDRGVYSSQLTLVQRGYEAWGQIEVFAPRADSVFRSPALARELIETAAKDGVNLWPARQTLSSAVRELFTPGFQRIQIDGVGEFLDEVIENPERRVAAIVAATSDNFSYEDSVERLERMVRQTVGVATLWVLDPSATEEFNALVPEEYRVFPSSLRTFQPGADMGDPSEAYAHRYIPTRDLFGVNSFKPFVIGNRLYHGTRSAALRLPVAEQLAEADRLIRERTHQQRMAGSQEQRVRLKDRIVSESRTTTDADDTVTSATQSGFVAVEEPKTQPKPEVKPGDQTGRNEVSPAKPESPEQTTPTESPRADLVGTKDVEANAELLATLRTVAGVLEIEGYETLDPQELVLGIGDLADQERQAANEMRVYAEELETARIEMQLEKEIEESELEASIEELSKIEERELDLRKEIAHLQLQLARLKAPKEAYTLPEPEAPDSMHELMAQLHNREFDSVIFTGDKKEAFSLDDRPNAGLIARVAWEAVTLLQNYATLPQGERKSVHAFITGNNTTLPPNKHAPSETSDLRNNPDFSLARYLPVPSSVDPEGKTYMWAHFKLSQAGGKAPRMHYFDATGIDGKIYIGYIGKHLPSRLTN